MFEVTHRDAVAHPHRLDAVGDLDVFAASALREALRRCSDRAGRVVVDLSGVTWANASGLRHLAQTRRDLAEAGVPLVLVGASTSVTTMSRRAQLGSALGAHAA